ncbi:3-deoxy-D-arabinoheptulosonate-7-phosphate synthase [Peptoclostridium litorale DSM 5388]|uniref:Phospho-2-dehydro-3-deoxyheptonate aldolase AroF n=1 Tax=Peptoclostridium litorale DSM 5388 TaxID=1121324 RepID=A0A069RI84_PEPLI|nr:3-deoxy-7-phosphoheptulonate synthase [Peptoclostridium litorale]KDR95860.1 phospho-2-dehydro-3-deoxyheptonate aldolase AroF [Peptoclostridium litorale DSM 5388]SIO11194.1 3-deoxy-D-arabinoheptulosonate-7-phosphate synthase [Peptoclostridium litorale DSM 5388]
MVIVMKPGTARKDIEKIKEKMESLGCAVHEVEGESYNIIGLIGDTSNIDSDIIQADRNVEKVVNIQEPFKKAHKLFKPEDTIVNVNGKKIGGGNIAVIAGPCSVESREQIIDIAVKVKESGAAMLRGGAFKPRTSPYSFQGLREEGLELLLEAKKVTGLPIVTEIMSAHHIDIFEENVDVIQIGARNMQNFELLKAVGKTSKPILLKRGLSSSVEELIMSAEYIMAEGNNDVILCERGIRTFETYTRNTLDLSAIPVIKRLSHLPVIVDPSHATGHYWMVEALAKAAIAVGADGLIIEVHNDPENALCDGPQSLKPEKFKHLMDSVRQIASIENKNITI